MPRPRFTSEQAKQAQKLGIAARRHYRRLRLGLTQHPEAKITEADACQTQITVNSVMDHLLELDRRMLKAKDSGELDALTRSFDRMFNVWTVLRKIDSPESRRFKSWSKSPLPGTTPGPVPDPGPVVGPVVGQVVVSVPEPVHKPSLEPTQDTQKANESIG